LFNQEILFWVF